ncbi:M16 family metallopeptidase [Dongia deserti]|uniref:M16 family metallopeptidase n=1 Tax=Dongia deserti TaxID=2268030 RepID=UPI000E65584B|nr:pitrilysin family protein [Dongia deserti]
MSIPAADSVRVTTLSNGFRVATDRMDSVETTSLGVWAGVGTRNEPAEHNGVAHLLEHMAFKGTRRRSARDIVVEIEDVGGFLNAYTGREQTAYYAKVLAEDTPLVVDILADILQNSVFDTEELARERAVVLQEIGQAEDTPDDIVFDHFQETAFPNQAMGRPVLGRAEIVRDLPRDVVAGYMASRYRAGQMVLAAAGRIDHDALVEMAEKLFAGLPAGAVPPSERARYAGGDGRYTRDLEQVHLVLGFEGVTYTDADYYVAAVLSQLVGGGMSSRLFQEIREKRGLVYSIHSFASSYADGGIFGVYAGTGEKEVAELLPVVCDELAKLPHDLTDQEVERAKAQLRAATLMSREKPSARCEQLASQLLVYGRPIPPAEAVARINAVTIDDLARLARRLTQSPPTLTSMGPVGRVMEYGALTRRLP